jgi:hypothetical protein
MLKQMDEMGKTNWVTSIKRILFTYGFGEVWLWQQVGDDMLFVSMFNQRLKDCWHKNGEAK